ncbi:MAG: ABC transporter substrate-binding protein, partial [Verrucomicrobiota bacterium]
MKTSLLHLLLAGLLACLVSCGSDNDSSAEFPPYDNTEEVDAFFKADPERFVFATPEDIPEDLEWINGAELSDIGSPNAKKGGTLYGGLPDFPRTLRHVGPDSTGSFRPYILDDMSMNYAHRH